MASHKLTSGPHLVSLGFLESLPAYLATSILILVIQAYSLSLFYPTKRLQGCLELSAPGKCLFAYYELISYSLCIILFIHIYNSCTNTFHLLLYSLGLYQAHLSFNSIQVELSKAQLSKP